MIKLLPVFVIIAVSLFLFIKVFDKFIELVLFFHVLCKYRYVFDDYETELFRLEHTVRNGENENDRIDTGGKTIAEVRESLEKDLSAYRSLICSNQWKYRCWKLFFHEHRLVRAIDGTEIQTEKI